MRELIHHGLRLRRRRHLSIQARTKPQPWQRSGESFAASVGIA
jgi:hypothetical protein